MKQEQHHHQGENSQSQTVNNFWRGGCRGGWREWGDRWAVQKFVEQKTCELFKIMLVHRQKLHRVGTSCPKGVPWCIFNYVSAICQQIKVRYSYLKLTNRLGRRKSERTRTDERHNLRLALPRPAVCYLSVRDFSCSWRRFPLKIHLNIISVRFLARLFSASVWHLAKCDDKTSSLISHMAFNELQTRTHTHTRTLVIICLFGLLIGERFRRAAETFTNSTQIS